MIVMRTTDPLQAPAQTREGTSRRRSLQTQLLSGFALAVTLPMVALAAIGGTSYVRRERAKATDRLTEVARAVRGQVQGYVNGHAQALASLARAIEASGHFETTRLDPWLARFHADYPGFLTMFAADRAGDPTAAHPVLDAAGVPMTEPGHNVADRDYFRRALAGDVYISDAFRGRAFGSDAIVAISAPIRDGTGRVRGVLEGSLDLQEFRQFGSDYATLEGASISVLDRLGRIVYSSSPEREVLAPFDAPSAKGAGRPAGEALGCADLIEGRRRVGYTRVCEPMALGWVAVVEQSDAAILQGAARYLWIMGVLVAAGIALAVGLAQLFARPVTGPLARLARSVRHREPGTLRRGVAIAARSPVEVADLMHGVEEWEAQVEERTRLLVAAQQELEHDIAQRVRAEDEAARLRERLAHVSRVASMGDMAAGIAHEINQPLTAIAAYATACARLIRSGGLRREQVFETLDYIGEEALRAGGIIHGVRAMVRSQPSPRTPCDVNRLISDAARLARVDPRLQDLRLRLELTERLSPVLVDGVQIQQVLLNLIVNGAEATERGNGAGEIVVRTSQDESTVCVSVTDRGAGLSPAVEKELFRPFFTTKRTGMGMGLSISRTIIEYHGGRLWFTPTEPRGTTFHFALPRA